MATLGLTDAERQAVERFEQQVIEPSMRSLVILDFWAEWCGPCKQLGPTLEKVASDYAAKGVKLVKIDVDQEKLIAAQFRIQSIPTVYAIHRGQPVADLTNHRSEAQIKRALDQLLAQLGVEGDAGPAQADVEPLIASAEDMLRDGEATRAAALFKQIAEAAPGNSAVTGGLVRALAAAGATAEAQAILDGVPADLSARPEIVRARAALELAAAAPPGEVDTLEARIAANPDDHEARFDLAGARMAERDHDGAAEHLLEIVSRDRDWNDGAARKRFLQLLEARGLEDPWSRAQRRRLSALLFT